MEALFATIMFIALIIYRMSDSASHPKPRRVSPPRRPDFREDEDWWEQNYDGGEDLDDPMWN